MTAANQVLMSFLFFFQVEKIVTVMTYPKTYKIPNWFLNRQKDIVDGKYNQVILMFYDLQVER